MNKLSTSLLVITLASSLLSGCSDSKPTPHTPQTSKTIPENLKFSVLKADRSSINSSRIEVQIDRRLTLPELNSVANFIYEDIDKKSQESTIFFYLPTQVAGMEMAWARVNLPSGEAKILGLSVDAAKSLQALPRPSGTLIGSWLDDGMGMRQTIVKQGSKLVLFREFESGKNERELIEIKAQPGERTRMKYRDKDYSRNGEYLVISTEGELFGYDKDGKIFTASPILFEQRNN